MTISVGKYVHKNTFLHKLDPRVKLLFNILFIVLFFIISHLFTFFLIILPILILYVCITKKPLSLLKMIKVPLFIFVFMSVFYSFISDIPDEKWKTFDYWRLGFQYLKKDEIEPWFKKEWINLEKIGFVYTTAKFTKVFSLSLRIYTMLIITTLLIYTTKPILLTKAIEDIMSPLKLLRINTSIIAMIISIAIRFIPTLLLETNRILKAQASRGVDFKNGKIKDKVKSMVSLTIPLFVLSFARADDLANAMEVRGYSSYAKRTKYRTLRLKWFDFLFIIGFILLVVVAFLIEYDVIFLPKWWLLSSQRI
ncbi:energy-coupling factor transporter transmembrane component T family protein [Mesomycoplasma neurolyticum]|uniref:Energy-coupling factor transporter transmembrane protein EcfT n=1 Tax=Mesomycoplasma neurolyticum TaxID=2120 RepID=A0A449A4J5_9BACT|nr:energy-coupling factor transporter transmembrane component T [Mesomycoplasma neurolyticum]VEU59156.1 Energy-coupling factor transporter transmembrane protein EcfT [Mesomycoplasma neurolyticum]